MQHNWDGKKTSIHHFRHHHHQTTSTTTTTNSTVAIAITIAITITTTTAATTNVVFGQACYRSFQEHEFNKRDRPALITPTTALRAVATALCGTAAPPMLLLDATTYWTIYAAGSATAGAAVPAAAAAGSAATGSASRGCRLQSSRG